MSGTQRGRLAAAMTLIALVSSPAAALVILDHSPTTFATAVLQPTALGNFQNLRAGQHFADDFLFGADSLIDGMDLYSGSAWGTVGDTVTVQLWTDNGGMPGALIDEFTETIALVDGDGARGDVTRKHVAFSVPLIVMAGIRYWIGMSGGDQQNPDELALLGLGNPGSPDDGAMATFNGDTFTGLNFGIGDTAMRLHGQIGIAEPASLALIGLGIAALGVRRRR